MKPKHKYRVHLKHGVTLTFRADDFIVTRSNTTAACTAWEAVNASKFLSFSPTDVVAVEGTRRP